MTRPLDDILEEAARDEFLANTICLHDDQFVTIRAPSDGSFRTRLDEALFTDVAGDLARAHKANFAAGLEIVEPVQSGLRGGRWSLCNIARIGDAFPAGDAAYASLAQALLAAIEWWQIEPWCRSVLARVCDIRHTKGG
ncbi:MAG TPA: hypothetical protein VMB73_35590 [Acetobacteraceae bacterium]|nr:hypothetical protein [Acetobacteraceae bacterium]